MKILLVKPPQNPNLVTSALYEPLELEYLGASVKDSEVRILDMRIDRNLYGELLNFCPDLVGITAYTCDYNIVVQILKKIKEFNKSIRTVVGGHHVTFKPEDFVLPFVDAIFIGYADYTFPMYIKAFNNLDQLRDIPNIGIIENNVVSYTRKEVSAPDLNSLPLPDRSLISKYRKKYHDPVRNNLTLLMTSRGCPFRCNFCACWKIMNGQYSSRTPESIINELKSLPEEIKVVYFSDDNTFNDIGRMRRLSKLIKENNIKKKFQMYTRADTVVRHQDLFEDLAEAGLQFVTIGLESFNDKDLQYFKKKTSVEINNQAIQILKKLNIYLIAHLIVRPEYTKEDFEHLLRYVYDHNLFRPAFPVLTPLPGTELYEETSEIFQITNFDFFDFAHSILPTRLEPKEFYKQLTNLYIKSFSLLRYLRHRFKIFLSFDRQKYNTDNTDGITAYNLLILSVYSVAIAIKLKFSYKNRSRFLMKNAMDEERSLA